MKKYVAYFMVQEPAHVRLVGFYAPDIEKARRTIQAEAKSYGIGARLIEIKEMKNGKNEN